ncbi:MAG: hypothetical protein WBV93_13385 [Anaerobacillus sp.]
MKKTTKYKIGFIGSILLLIGSLITIFTTESSPQTTVVHYIFLLSGLTGIIAYTVIIKKAKRGAQ